VSEAAQFPSGPWSLPSYSRKLAAVLVGVVGLAGPAIYLAP
jgi:hypothetical protein